MERRRGIPITTAVNINAWISLLVTHLDDLEMGFVIDMTKVFRTKLLHQMWAY